MIIFSKNELKLVKIVRCIFWGILVLWGVGLLWIYFFEFIPARDVWIMSL